MGERLTVHPHDPQPRAMQRALEVARAGGLLLCPTDAGYALVWCLDARHAEERVLRLRMLDNRHPFALLCASLSEASKLARIDDRAFRLIKSSTPGPVTFILPAAAELPKRLKLAKRKSIGVRIPDHRVTQRLLADLREPLLTSSADLPGAAESANHEAEWVAESMLGNVDLMLDCDDCPAGPTSVIDCTGPGIEVLRQGHVPVEV